MHTIVCKIISKVICKFVILKHDAKLLSPLHNTLTNNLTKPQLSQHPSTVAASDTRISSALMMKDGSRQVA